jgi:hypothetical protein
MHTRITNSLPPTGYWKHRVERCFWRFSSLIRCVHAQNTHGVSTVQRTRFDEDASGAVFKGSRRTVLCPRLDEIRTSGAPAQAPVLGPGRPAR